MNRVLWTRSLAVIAVLLFAAGCSGNDAVGGESSSEKAVPTTNSTGSPVTTDGGSGLTPGDAPDFNGDGVVRIGVATDGPRDDGAFFQALVERVEQISAEKGFETPIIVDKIDPANSRVELENLAAQAVDIIAIGSAALADGNDAVFTEFGDIFWYCNCGSGFQDTPGLLRIEDSALELNLSAGYATGLLLLESGGDNAVFLGCCDLDFEKESFLAFEYGLTLVDEGFTATYAPTGNFPFDFGNAPGATEAYHNAVAQGADAVYPFLGGAHEPIVRLANADGLRVMTAGSSNGCERDDIDYDIEVKFDAGDYLEPAFEEILSGQAEEGGSRKFTVGIDPQGGAELCNGTPEQDEALDIFKKAIGAGEYNDEMAKIVAAVQSG